MLRILQLEPKWLRSAVVLVVVVVAVVVAVVVVMLVVVVVVVVVAVVVAVVVVMLVLCESVLECQRFSARDPTRPSAQKGRGRDP